jgi:probable pyridine nucleotide-disulfide oxidoreductase
MAVVQTAMQAKQPYQALRDSIIAHPTMAEGLNDLFAAVQPKGRVSAA